MRIRPRNLACVSRSWYHASLLACSLVASACDRPDASSNLKSTVEVRPIGPEGLELSGVISVAVARNGSIIVGDRGLPGLRVIRADGGVVSLGRAGSGPGEFEALTRVHLCLDGTIAAYDFAQARLHFFTEDGFLRQSQLPPSLVTGDVVGCASSDSLIVSRLPDQVPGVGLHTVPITLFQHSPGSGSVKWLATLRGTEMFFSARFQAFYERPYGLQTLLAYGRRGVVFAENSRIQIFRILSDGATSPIFLAPHSTVSVRKSYRALYVRDRLAEEPDSGARVVLRGVLSEVPWAESVPPIDRLLMSSTGEVWIRHTPVGEDSVAQWLVVDSLQELRATVRLPRRFRVMFIDGSQILGVEDLPSGEERLVHAIRPPS